MFNQGNCSGIFERMFDNIMVDTSGNVGYINRKGFEKMGSPTVMIDGIPESSCLFVIGHLMKC